MKCERAVLTVFYRLGTAFFTFRDRNRATSGNEFML